jgi:hypothetical protein
VLVSSLSAFPFLLPLNPWSMSQIPLWSGSIRLYKDETKHFFFRTCSLPSPL